MSDVLYDGPNRVIIDDNTPETNTLPVSGGKGVDEFLITRTANSVVIDDDSEANVTVFERDVVITSIERQAGSEGASVAQYVITLSSGKTITLRNPASFTFQHLGDATRTDPISAEDFITAYEDGFAASDASHPDIIGDASGPSGSDIVGAAYEGDLSTSGDLDVNDDTLLASTTPFTISTQGTYGTASIGDDGEWVYKLYNGNTDVRALNSGDTLTDTFVVDVNLASGRAKTQTVTITISGRTDVFGTNGRDRSHHSLGDANTSDNQAIFGFNSRDTLTGGSGDDLLVGGYGTDDIDLIAGGTDTVVYRINSSDTDGFVKAEDGFDAVFEFTPGEDKLVILDVNGSPTTLAALFDSLTGTFQLRINGDDDRSGNLSSSELDAGARFFIDIVFQASGTSDGGPTSNDSGSHLRIIFDRVTSEALNDRAVWDTLTGGTNFSERTISTVAQLSSLFGGFGRPGYDAALDDGGFISIIGPDDLPDSYFEIVPQTIEPQSGVEGQEKVIDLITLFTHVDEGDELTFEVTLDDGTALSMIGLTYDSDEDEITGTLTGTGTYVIKIVATDKSGAVATDKSGATVEATFDLNILSAIPIIQRNSLTYNPDVTSITIDETMLEVTSGNASDDPTLLVYTITTLPDAGMLLKSGTPLNNGDTFTQADINNGLIVYQPSVSNPSTSQSNPLSFTLSDGVADLEEQTLEITSREVVGNTASAQDNTIGPFEAAPQKINGGDGSDIITSGDGNDQIDGDAGDDEIKLTRTVHNVEEDAGADEVLYTFGYDGVGIDGGDEIVGFKRGQDKVTFVVQDSRQFANLEEFLGSLKGVDDEDLTADDAFIATMMWGLDENGVFYFDGVLLHFKEGTSFGGGRVSSPLVTVTFDQRLDLNDLVEILGEADKVAANFDFTHAAFKNLNEVLPRLFGESSIDFVVLPFSNSISVIDGPVTGAEVFFDIDDDGEVSDVEKDAQRDASGRSLYITSDDGSVSFPKKYVGRAFVAVVDSAYDTDSGERLEGEFRSLDEGRGGIATPITDLIVTYLEEVEGLTNIPANAPTTEQEVLDEIFGDDEVMVADILDMGNYKVPESGAPGEVKKQMIIRAAIALAEIKKDETLAVGDGNAPVTKAEIIETIQVLLAMPDDSSIARLKGAVDARVDEAVAVKGGKPIGTPDDVETTEDTDYEFPETLVDLIELFGFLDPSGNSSSANASAFRGVYIKVTIENGVLLLDDNTPVVESTAGLGDVSVPSITGYIYITLDKLDTLKLRPAPDFNGNLELIYRVWDGEQPSSDVTLTITVTSVNDDPVATGSRIVGQNGQVGHAITAIDLSALFTDIDDEIVTLDVFFFDSSIKEVNIGLSYNVADGIIGSPTRSGLYTIEVVASDNRGGEATLEFPILILPDVESLTKVSGNGGVNAVVSNDDASSSQFLTGGDNAQTLNAGDAGDLIFGGRGDDIINLGDGMDIVIYRYSTYPSTAYDGGDVINNFNLGKDILVLAHVDDNVHNNAAAFLDDIKGFSLLVNDNGNITGIVFIFSRFERFLVLEGNQIVSTSFNHDTRLTLNFEGSISSEDIDLTAFNAVVDGRRTDKRGQETIAYQALESATEGVGLALINFKDINFINEIDDATPPSQILLGDDNIQTLNYGASGNLIFGGRGDDIINLGDGSDDVYYRYDGVDDSDSAAFDGGDVINNFDLDKDRLRLYHAEGNIHLMYNDDDFTTFFDAIKSVSLLDSGGKITGIVFTFIDRAEGANDDDEIDLTVNLENDDFISSEDIDLTAFNEVEIGKWTIKTDQETAAYQTIIDDVFRSALRLSSFFIVSGYGVNGVTIGDEAATSRQFLIGGDNVQTLNAGPVGDDIVGGKDDDIINLGDGDDYIFYGYDGADKTDSAAYDGGDVINNFDLDRDQLRLLHVGNNVHSSTAEFYAAIKGVSLLVGVINGDEIITGIVFTFTDRDAPTEEIDLTVNFENADFISPESTALTAFNEEVSGRRTIKTGQEIAAYQVIDAILPYNLYLYNFGRTNAPVVDTAPPSQILIGDDNAQTLNAGAGGDYIFGGGGDDIINLGDGPDIVLYRYDGVDDSDSAAFDGGDVINNFDLDEDRLRLHHAEGNIHLMYNDDDFTTFFDAIKGVSLLDSSGKITGIVFTFIDRAEGADDDAEIDLTVNLENDDFISSEDIDLTAFNEEVSGRRTIKTDQETAAYQTIIDDVFRSALNLSDRLIVSGYGVNGVAIGDKAATSSQYLLGGDNAQTLNAGTGGGLIFGGKGDDIINLGDGEDFVYYGYDGADKTDSAAYDGGDVINNFQTGVDELILLHVGNNVHSNTTEFYAAIKGVSLLVGVINGDENITGIVFTFTDRDTPTEEIDLTVNFENADFIFPESTDLTAFNEEVSGRRTIKTGQEIAAYQVIDTILGYTLSLYNFAMVNNNAPVVDIAIGTQIGTVGLPITAITLENLFYDLDYDELTLTVTGLPSGLSYYDRYTGITGTPDTVGTFMVTVVANDGNGGTAESTFYIVVRQIMNADTVDIVEDSGEGGNAPEITGTIGLADPTPPDNLQGTYGVLEFDADTKTWTYTLDNDNPDVQALAEGQEVTETFTFTDATAGSDDTQDVVITVVGANDAPIAEDGDAIGAQTARLDQPTVIDLSDLFTDVDANDTLTLTVTGLPSGLTYSERTDLGGTPDDTSDDTLIREITGTPDTEGEFTVTVVANDGNGGTVESTFVVAVVGQIVNEDTVEPVSGTISLADPTDPGVLQGTYGELTFVAATKTWTYTLNNTSALVQALAERQTETETFTFTDATDNSVTEDVEITVVGVNDAPEITASGGVSVQDGETSFATNLTVDDVDDGDLAALTSGSFTLAAGTGATAAIVNKFEVVNINGQWQLQLKSGQSIVLADAATFIINVSVTDAGGLTDNVDVAFTVAPARVLIDAGNSDIVGAAFEGDLSTNGDLDVNGDVTLATTTPFTISTQGTYGTASIGDDGEWVYTLDNGNAAVRALNSGETLTDTFVVNVTATDGAQAQTITITISGRTDVLGTNAGNSSLGDASTSDNQAIFGFNYGDTLTGGSGDDLLVGGYGEDTIDLSMGGIDTVVYRINSSDDDGLVKAEDGDNTVIEFTPGEDKLVILDVNGSPTTLAGFFDGLEKDRFQLDSEGDDDSSGDLSSSELDAGARFFIDIVFQSGGTDDGVSTSTEAENLLIIQFDRVTSEALNDITVWDTLTGGTDFSASTISTAALLSSLFGGFGRPGYDAALDAGDFISIIGPDDLPDSYFEFA